MAYDHFSPDGNAEKDTRARFTREIKATVCDLDGGKHEAIVKFEVIEASGPVLNYVVSVESIKLPEGIELSDSNYDILEAIKLELKANVTII